MLDLKAIKIGITTFCKNRQLSRVKVICDNATPKVCLTSPAVQNQNLVMNWHENMRVRY